MTWGTHSAAGAASAARSFEPDRAARYSAFSGSAVRLLASLRAAFPLGKKKREQREADPPPGMPPVFMLAHLYKLR